MTHLPRPLSRQAAALALTAACTFSLAALAQAQTAPTKPATPAAAKPAAAKPAAAKKPAAADKMLSLGGGGASAPADGVPRRGLLDRDELRICLKEEVAIRTRLEQAEAQRKLLNDEKTPLEAERLVLKGDREALDVRQRQASEELNVKYKAFAVRIEAWNKRVADFNEAKKSGAAAERERKTLDEDRVQFDKERPALEADKTAMVAKLEADVKGFNDKAAKADQRTIDWNRRNNETNDANQALEGERKTWVQTCANRRYREEDEAAIKQGK